jgi:UPF0716 family protein affecting phage T7 exclusion
MIKFLVLLLTLAEVVTLVISIKLLGFGLTILLAIGAMFGGVWLLRRQGLQTLNRFVTRLEFGQAPMDEAWDGFCILGAAILFIIPGLFTDLVALLLLIGPLRRAIYHWLSRSGRMSGNYWFDQQALAPSKAKPADVIDATYVEVQPAARSGP